jgi:hypothetical protein
VVIYTGVCTGGGGGGGGEDGVVGVQRGVVTKGQDLFIKRRVSLGKEGRREVSADLRCTGRGEKIKRTPCVPVRRQKNVRKLSRERRRA